MAKVLRAPHPTLPTPCWLWQGWKNELGYGIVRVNYRYVRAHRLFYEHFVGPIPEGLGLLHACDTPECVSPEHLRPGTQQENMADAKERSRIGGAPGVNAAKTHCINGHPLTQEGNRRRCKVCKNASERRRYADRKLNSDRPPANEDECQDP